MLLFCWNVRLTGNATVAVLAVLLTLLCGGVGGFVWLFTDFTWGGFFQYVQSAQCVTVMCQRLSTASSEGVLAAGGVHLRRSAYSDHLPHRRSSTLLSRCRVDHILYVVNNGPASILWLSLPAHILLPQRTTLFAYPMALLSLIIITRAYTSMHSTSGLT